MPRRLVASRLKPGARFRFAEQRAWQGFPYVTLDVSVSVKGSSHFATGERPIAFRCLRGSYPRYGSVAGFFPVTNREGKLSHWVLHPDTEVLVPGLAEFARLALFGLLALLLALALSYPGLFMRGGDDRSPW